MEIHTDLLKTTLKRYQTVKRKATMEYMVFGSRIHLHSWQTRTRKEQGAQVPEWMTKGKTKLIQKNPSKVTAPNNYRPITYLPMMWKILTTQIRKEIYYSLTSRGLFPEEQKGYRKGSRSTTELLYMAQHILKKSKTRRKKPRYVLDWQQKGIWYGPAKLDNKMP